MANVWEHEESDRPVIQLTAEESWDLLGRAPFGRLGYHLGGEVDIAPINAVVDGERLVFRTSEGNKLLGIHMSDDVVYEVDEIVDGVASSVVARGRARVLSGTEEEQAESLPLAPMVPTWKGTFVAIEVTSVTGRRFRLQQSS